MWIEVIGIVGMVLLLGTFYLASSKRIQDNHYLYHILNLIGAIAVLVNAFFNHVMSVAAVEVAWSIIALVGLWNIWRAHRKAKDALE
ncbi:MAG: hypothetical protein COV45_06870 [Deltaproteobacteria bacterium CG11_big_fil_rev_8_21_14_0_20_47_16]|nr:MAG: hypothetical protein COV45_06870 [Deltaproteobacteria bacterium CG11_big_fil_rev_8_21_14_0_20_47_16]